MKTKLKLILISIFICGFSNILKAQEVENPPEELTDQTWYLTKMIIDEEEMPFTPNEEIEYVKFIVGSYSQNTVGFGLEFCAGPGSEMILEGEDEFYIKPLLFLMNNRVRLDETTNSYCNLEENIILEGIYFYEFWNNSDLYLGHDFSHPFHFSYTINQLEEHKELIVINDNGDEAHFQNVPYMSVNDQQITNLTLYPNPANDFLYIENLTNPVQIDIYDLSGKVLLSKEVSEAIKQVNVSQLAEGVYLYQLSQNGLEVKTGKLVKK
ncbi:MAG TPA: T9SS type A sorting domain-containing protein [Flavobacteriaceae bacterium]|nr:T9SS type A sorting domain-containing protein [Flavobacteriaceae bacterium]